jgi:2-dehydro-3-deoxyphosphogluconate aldolase/(4S)-4-hydroxy-2-oxoglutarate aldolase
MSRGETIRGIEAQGAVAVLRLEDAASLRPVVEALAQGGMRAIEVTMTMRGALDAVAALGARAANGILIGAGTVLDAETARLAILAGARFVVAPTFSPALIEMCHRYDVAAIPGGYTPTEVLAAWQAGADLVKVFPAGGLGPGYLKDLRGPMPQIRLMPTGGVSADNAGAYLAAGAVAVGVGGALVDNRAIARGDFSALTKEARRLVQAIRAAREGNR